MKFVTPSGSTVQASDEMSDRLLALGYKPFGDAEPQKPAAKPRRTRKPKQENEAVAEGE